jgi:hypothetical protein
MISTDLSFIPIRPGTKMPTRLWDEYKENAAAPETVEGWVNQGYFLGLVTGKVSGNLEVIDFDRASLFEPWCLKMKELGLTEVLDSIVLVKTIKGYHLYYRCEEIGRCQRLALSAETGKAIIETRAEGGYVVTPSVNDRRYKFLQGRRDTITVITPEQRELMLEHARSYCEKPKVIKGYARVAGRPGDDYNDKANWEEILTADDWTFVRTRSDGVSEWRRPGKTDEGISATVGIHDLDLLYVFSSSVMNLEPGAFTKFAYLAHTKFESDYEATAKWLAENGYGDPIKTSKRANVAAKLNELASSLDTFVGRDGIAYAYLENLGVHPIESNAYKAYLDKRATEELGTYLSPNTLDEVSKKQAWRVSTTGEEQELFTRVGWNQDEGAVYVDLGQRGSSRAVRIDKDGWRLVDNPGVNFKRSARPVALPDPATGGDISVMREIFNTATEDDYLLLCAWIISSFNPHGTFPILVIQGGPGAAKTTTTSLVRRIIDPAFPALLPYPKSLEQLLLNGYHNYVLAFDNLSGISNDISDALCVVASGSGFATRKLYTNTEQVAFEFKRPIIVNGIDHLAHRADFASRSLCLEFTKIPKDKQKTDKWLANYVANALPGFLGAVYTAVAGALRRYDTVITDDIDSRLTDFTTWTLAALDSFGWSRDSFAHAMTSNTQRLVESLAEMDLVAQYVLAWMDEREEYEETPSSLYEDIQSTVPPQIKNKAKDWPATPRVFVQRLLRAEPTLRAMGLRVERSRSKNKRTIKLYHDNSDSN